MRKTQGFLQERHFCLILFIKLADRVPVFFLGAQAFTNNILFAGYAPNTNHKSIDKWLMTCTDKISVALG